jgi:hypothetical protein
MKISRSPQLLHMYGVRVRENKFHQISIKHQNFVSTYLRFSQYRPITVNSQTKIFFPAAGAPICQAMSEWEGLVVP